MNATHEVTAQNPDATTDPTDDPENNTIEHEDAHAYKCPRCNTTYNHELLARVHITRAQDDNHKNHDGLMPEETIEAVDENGDVIDTITRRPREINVRNLTIDDFPDDYTTRSKHALLTAAHNPYETTYTELETKTNTALNEHALDELSYNRVYRVIREFYENKTMNNTTVVESFNDLTQKQQAIVVARVAHPDESQSQLANHVGDGVSRSYPHQVLARTEPIVDELRDLIENGDSIETAVKTITDDNTIYELHRSGLIDNVDVDFTDVAEAFAPDTENTDEVGDEPVTDAAITNETNVFTAAPDDTPTADDHENTTDNEESVPVAEIETVRDRVELLDRVLENPQATAVTTEIKNKLDNILNTAT